MISRLRRCLAVCCFVAVSAGCAKRNAIIIGTDATYPPFEFVDDKGHISGVSLAIGNAIGKQAGKSVEYVNMSFEGLIPALKSGQIDLIISSITANEKRRESIDFSDPYVKTGLAILIAKDSSVQTAADLRAKGRKLAVRIGTTGEQWCRQELADAQLISLDSDAACVLEVVNGTVDAWVYDQISVMNYNAKHPDRTRAVLAPLREEVWAVGLRQGQADLKAQVNQAIAKMKKDGEFSKLAEQYLSKERELLKAQGLPFLFE